MYPRIALIAVCLLVASPVFADNAPGALPQSPSPCRENIEAARAAFVRGDFAVSPDIAQLMVNVIDGKLTTVRSQLRGMSPEQHDRWRQVAMLTAVFAQQSAEVDALLDDGAAVDGTALLPGLKTRALSHALAPIFDARAQRTLTQAGALDDHATPTGPALPAAASCGDVATVDVLLHHHADVMARQAPNIADALQAAILQGNAAMVQRLLDHGANACADDRRRRHRQLGQRGASHSLAELGQRAGLPRKLTTRLSCPAVASEP